MAGTSDPSQADFAEAAELIGRLAKLTSELQMLPLRALLGDRPACLALLPELHWAAMLAEAMGYGVKLCADPECSMRGPHWHAPATDGG